MVWYAPAMDADSFSVIGDLLLVQGHPDIPESTAGCDETYSNPVTKGGFMPGLGIPEIIGRSDPRSYFEKVKYRRPGDQSSAIRNIQV
jgi:hypothetical protein